MGLSVVARSQVLVRTDFTVDDLVRKILLTDTSGVSIQEINFTGDKRAIGAFYAATNYLPIKNGIVLSTGMAERIDGPNTTGRSGLMLFAPGDSDLDKVANGNSADAAILEFVFYPNTDQISFNYFFGSEEYPEFVNHGVNDVFAFFISGPGYPEPVNIAKLPDSDEPVTVDHVNANRNSAYYIENMLWVTDNYDYFTAHPDAGERSYSFQFDGMTTLLEAKAKVIPYQPYHLKIAIADVGDNIYDSGVFLKAKSLKSKGEKQPFSKLMADELKKNKEREISGDFTIEGNEVKIISTIQFEFNSASILDEYMDELNNMVRLLNQYFDVRLKLIGHTDDIGSEQYNMDLSYERAKSIGNYLIKCGIDARRIVVEGKGNKEPLVKNTEEFARAKNRRVEFIFY